MWDVQDCRKNSLGKPRWYPVFDSHDQGCKNDGLEPPHMKIYDEYSFESLEDCCEQYFPWNSQACINPVLAQDPCEYSYIGIYDEDFLLIDSEVGYYPVCKYQYSQVAH